MGFKCGIVACQRRQVHPVQRPYPGRHRRGKLPVLHHRAQCRRAGADPRQTRIAEIVKPQREVATTMEFVDIAGLVAGASRGEGLGNQFLANIRETDAIAHVVRCFEDDNVIHVANRIDPRSDIEVINTELALADLEAAKSNCKGDPHGQGRRQARHRHESPAGR